MKNALQVPNLRSVRDRIDGLGTHDRVKLLGILRNRHKGGARPDRDPAIRGVWNAIGALDGADQARLFAGLKL